MELYALQEVIKDIDGKPATLVALTPQLPEYSAAMVDKHALDFDILSDPGNAYAAQLGLRFEVPANIREIYLGFGIDLPACNGEPSWTLPMPGRIIVGADGVVRNVNVDPDYTVRPEPVATVTALKALPA